MLKAITFKTADKTKICLTLATAVLPILLIDHAGATPPPPPPDSGALLQQNQAPKPALPANNATGLKLEEPDKSNLPASAPFMIKTINISGNTLFDSATLHKLVAELEGQENTLEQLNAAVDRISEYYHERGYLLARAYVPAQTIQDGVVKIFVIEARYGEVHLDNSSLVDTDVIESTLSVLRSQDFVEQSKLNRTLLLLSDMPGLTSEATLQPGQTVATSDLMVETKAVPAFAGSAMLDNYGNAYTGRARLTGTFNWFDPLHSADVLSATLMTSGRNMNTGSLTYETLVSGQGARVGGMVSDLQYRLGDGLTALQAHGTAETASLWLKYPWQRSVELNINTQLQLDYKKLKDDIDSTGIDTNRHQDAAQFMLSGDARSDFLAGAQTTFAALLRGGEQKFDNAIAANLDEKSAKTAGGFMKVNFNYNRLQYLSQDTSLYLSLSTQWSKDNLDSSEKMVAGGAYSVRAYDTGVLSGDSGVLQTLELRQNLAEWMGGIWQAAVFTDNQAIRINQDPWTNGTNSAQLHGAGLGLNWANDRGWHVKVYSAAPVGSVPELLKVNKSVRTWAEIGAWF